MACYKPLRAWRGVRDRAIYWRKINDCDEIALPCGQCVGCRLERSRQWAVRCMHEAKMHRHNCFLTLTLNDEHLTGKYFTGKYYRNGQPAYAGTLLKRDVQLFWKRLRKALSKGRGAIHDALLYTPPSSADMGLRPMPPLKYYMAGEYGEQFRRPHYHACLFGVDFADKKYLCKSPTGEKLYRSPALEQLWTQGFSTIGTVTFESAAYVARYVMKKINGDKQKTHYEVIDQETGEIINLQPEYNDMSRREGIGKGFLNRYATDVYPLGKVIVRGKQTNAPRYYDKQYKRTDPYAYDELKLTREMEARAKWYENTHERLAVREQVATATINHLKRKL